MIELDNIKILHIIRVPFSLSHFPFCPHVLWAKHPADMIGLLLTERAFLWPFGSQLFVTGRNIDVSRSSHRGNSVWGGDILRKKIGKNPWTYPTFIILILWCPSAWPAQRKLGGVFVSGRSAFPASLSLSSCFAFADPPLAGNWHRRKRSKQAQMGFGGSLTPKLKKGSKGRNSARGPFWGPKGMNRPGNSALPFLHQQLS